VTPASEGIVHETACSLAKRERSHASALKIGSRPLRSAATVDFRIWSV
jgi:hypothetical protein